MWLLSREGQVNEIRGAGPRCLAGVVMVLGVVAILRCDAAGPARTAGRYSLGERRVSAGPAAVPCPECRIVVDTLLHLDGAAHPWLAQRMFISMDSRGRHHLTSHGISRGEIAVVDRSGRRVATYGRAGEGPGEGRLLTSPYFGPGDTAFVYDTQLRRFAVWTPELEFSRTFSVAAGVTDVLVRLRIPITQEHMRRWSTPMDSESGSLRTTSTSCATPSWRSWTSRPVV